jgi:hypothetical protein
VLGTITAYARHDATIPDAQPIAITGIACTVIGTVVHAMATRRAYRTAHHDLITYAAWDGETVLH